MYSLINFWAVRIKSNEVPRAQNDFNPILSQLYWNTLLKLESQFQARCDIRRVKYQPSLRDRYFCLTSSTYLPFFLENQRNENVENFPASEALYQAIVVGINELGEVFPIVVTLYYERIFHLCSVILNVDMW